MRSLAERWKKKRAGQTFAGKKLSLNDLFNQKNV
jgi:hypothetical protein